MRVLVQWATDPPSDWHEIDSRDWALLPDKGEPPADRTPVFNEKGEVVAFEGPPVIIDSTPGRIHAVNIQGVILWGDHVSIVQYADHVQALVWNDDVGDLTPDGAYAYDWRFYPVENNTRQLLTIYGGVKKRAEWADTETTGGKVVVRSYSKFSVPSGARHGIWLLEEQSLALKRVRRVTSCDEWLGEPCP